MRVRFWGVRGSVPWATPDSIGYGCNTPCVEVHDEASDRVLVLDAGSGIVGLGPTLGSAPRSVPIVLTHYHWDHLQGLPFFAPFHMPGWTSTIWAPHVGNIDAAWVKTIFESPFYPVPYEHLTAQPAIKVLDGGEADIEGFHLHTQLVNHPGGAFAYRIHGARGDLVYATDHEFGDPTYDTALGVFAHGARALIIDAHFTPAELPAHAGWGHSSWEQGARFAAAHDIGQLWLFHHKPGRSDPEVRAIEIAARALFPQTYAAREGEAFDL